MSAPSPPTAFTLGNPEAYEVAFDEGPVWKQPGGVVYADRKLAQKVIDAFEGCLPPHWFEGRRLPGRVYGLKLSGPICEVTERKDYGLALRVEAEVVRLT